MNEFKRVFSTPPLDWRKQRLGEFLERVDTRNVVGDQNVLTISAEHGLISQEEFFNRRVASENVAGYYRLVIGDFAYNKSYSRGYPMGAIRRLDRYPSGVVSPLYICFRLSVGAPVDSDFLAHYFDGGAIDTQLADVAKEGARNHGLLNVSVKEFFEIETALPPIEEQRCVAQILDTLDTAIREAEALIDKLKAVKQGLLHDLLTRGIDANGQLRPPQSEAPQLYKKTPLGWTPNEWEVEPIMRLTSSSVIGPFGSDLVASDYRVSGIPVIFVRDVKPDQLVWKSNVFVSATKAQALAAHEVRAGDVVATKMGMPPCVAAVYPKSMPCGIVTADIVRLRPCTDRICPDWMSMFINFSAVAKQVEQITAGVTRPKVTLRDVRDLLIGLPSIEEQERVLDRLTAMQSQIQLEKASHRKLSVGKAGLMDDLLTGRVRVTPLLDSLSRPAPMEA